MNAGQLFGRNTYGQIQDLRDELLTLKKSNLMKDDTIAFLQKEKEKLLKEVVFLILRYNLVVSR